MKFPLAKTDTFAPVVTLHAPDTDLAPIGMKNGTRLLSVPVTNTEMEVEPSLIEIEPAPVVAGMTRSPAR